MTFCGTGACRRSGDARAAAASRDQAEPQVRGGAMFRARCPGQVPHVPARGRGRAPTGDGDGGRHRLRHPAERAPAALARGRPGGLGRRPRTCRPRGGPRRRDGPPRRRTAVPARPAAGRPGRRCAPRRGRRRHARGRRLPDGLPAPERARRPDHDVAPARGRRGADRRHGGHRPPDRPRTARPLPRARRRDEPGDGLRCGGGRRHAAARPQPPDERRRGAGGPSCRRGPSARSR